MTATAERIKTAVGRCGLFHRRCRIETEVAPHGEFGWVNRRGLGTVSVGNMAFTSLPALAMLMSIQQCRITPDLNPSILFAEGPGGI